MVRNRIFVAEGKRNYMYIIANPAAGKGRGIKAAAAAAAYLTQENIPHTIVETTFPGEATLLAREAAQSGEKIVVACGGDGTMREVGVGVLGTGAALAILPGGTGNDYARGLGMDSDPVKAVKQILQKNIRKVDVGYANGTPFFNICAAGLDMDLFEASLPIKKYISGIMAYVLALFAILPKYRP